MKKLIKVNCENPGCKNKVMIIAGNPYFGILCHEHSRPTIYKLSRD